MFCRFGLGIVENLEQDGDPKDFFQKLHLILCTLVCLSYRNERCWRNR
jgi:hypothetical protein